MSVVADYNHFKLPKRTWKETKQSKGKLKVVSLLLKYFRQSAHVWKNPVYVKVYTERI